MRGKKYDWHVVVLVVATIILDAGTRYQDVAMEFMSDMLSPSLPDAGAVVHPKGRGSKSSARRS